MGLFFEEPSKQWHFEDVLKACKVSRSKASKWLAKLVRERVVRHVKPRGRMPYYQGNFESPAYRIRKRLYALAQLHATGFLGHLMGLPGAKTVIIFGSFTRADWYSGSDIDVFIYGSDAGLQTDAYRRALRRDIQVFVAGSPKDLERMGSGLLRNILEGLLIKGKLDFIQVTPLATV